MNVAKGLLRAAARGSRACSHVIAVTLAFFGNKLCRFGSQQQHTPSILMQIFVFFYNSFLFTNILI